MPKPTSCDSFIVYGLKDPKDKLFRYVGRTNNLASRILQHVKQYGTFNNQLSAWIAVCILPDVEELEVVASKDKAIQAETRWIKRLRADGHPLLNRDYSSLETKEKMAVAKRGQPSNSRGHKMSEEQKARMTAGRLLALAARGGKRSLV